MGEIRGRPAPVTSVEPSVDSLARRIAEELGAHLRQLGLPNNGQTALKLPKETIRKMHESHRKEVLVRMRELLASHHEDLENALATGSEVSPDRISPTIVPVRAGSDEGILFRLASLYWSVPVSNGYGRRMRFLVRDRQNGKLIGLIALTDPVFNLGARDQWIGWTASDRRERLRFVMDACVLGALPPYSYLLGGKLVAALAASNEVRAAFRNRYARRRSEICHRRSNAYLALLTTTSALGRSSVYDRLHVMDRIEYRLVGETKGYGHFHVPEPLFQLMRSYLMLIGHPYATGNRFGQGPNWRMRVIRQTLREIGIDPDILRHGISREVYVVPLAYNAKDFLRGRTQHLRPISAPSTKIVAYCKNRWIIPRALRDERFRDFRPEGLVRELRQMAGLV